MSEGPAFRQPGSWGDEDLQGLAVGHGPVTVRDSVQADDAVEDPARFDAADAFEHRVGAVAAGQLPYLLCTFLAGGQDDVGGAGFRPTPSSIVTRTPSRKCLLVHVLAVHPNGHPLVRVACRYTSAAHPSLLTFSGHPLARQSQSRGRATYVQCAYGRSERRRRPT